MFFPLSDQPPSLWEHDGPLSGCGVLGSGSPAASTSGVHPPPASHPPAWPQPGRICFSKPRKEWLTTPVSKQAMRGVGVGVEGANVKALFKQVFQLTTQSSHATVDMSNYMSCVKCAVTSGNCQIWVNLAILLRFKEFHAVFAVFLEKCIVHYTFSLKSVTGQSCESPVCISFEGEKEAGEGLMRHKKAICRRKQDRQTSPNGGAF